MMAMTSLAAAMLMTMATAPVPDGTRPSALDEELSINTIPTRVREWTLDLTLEDSRAFYRQYLGEQRVELRRDHGYLMAAPAAAGFTTVELQWAEAARTRVRISEARLGAGDASRVSIPIPLPPHTRLLSSVSDGPGSGAAQTLVARVGAGLGDMVSFFERALAQQGYRLTQRRPLRQPPHAAEALSFARANRSIDLVLTFEAGQTWIAAMVSGPAP
jgi:hypothetical protein